MSNTAQAAAPKQVQSRVGKRPIALPKGVTINAAGGKFEVKGPKGQLSRPATPNVQLKTEGAELFVVPTVEGRDGARFQGLARSILNGMVEGAANGYTRTLQLVGTGYRAEVKGKILNLALGFSTRSTSPSPTASPSRFPPTPRARS